MNNFKKIGLTALAGSLVATSVYAGEMSVAGSASLRMSNHAGTDGGKTMAMGNQLTFTGSGEMDNGMNVALSFILDQGDDHPAAAATAANAEARADSSPFDSHSITISSDSMGSVVFAGEGASSAQNTIDTTAAGDIWDNTFASYTKATNASAGSKTLTWTLPSMVDGLGVVASYNGSSAGEEGTIGYALTYTGRNVQRHYFSIAVRALLEALILNLVHHPLPLLCVQRLVISIALQKNPARSVDIGR